MATSKAEIREWLLEALDKEATHLLVVCDTFDWEDYPVYVLASKDLMSIASDYHGKNNQKIMEVYDLALDLEPQLAARRTFPPDFLDALSRFNNDQHGVEQVKRR